MMEAPAAELSGVTKRFPKVTALAGLTRAFLGQTGLAQTGLADQNRAMCARRLTQLIEQSQAVSLCGIGRLGTHRLNAF